MTPSQNNITIASTFSADPVKETIRFWLERLQLQHSVNFATPFQLIQHLLNPESPLAINPAGVNVILLRWEDLVATNTDDNNALHEFIEALTACVNRNALPCLVISCPSSIQLSASSIEQFIAWDRVLEKAFSHYLNVQIVTSSDLQSSYQLKPDEKAQSEQFAQIPFSPVTFSAIGTQIARHFHSFSTPPYKIIAVDCDDTLWGGTCGEDGPQGVRVDQPHLALQQFILEQHDQGALLCLCSRNNEEDVTAVFHQRTEMPLQLDHFVATRINWAPKSDNILALKEQLGLNADSIIFLDDNPLECELMRRQLPSVLTLQLPSATEEYNAFLKRVWAFDRIKTTDEDRLRTSHYKNEQKREAARDAAPSLQAFLDGLELNVKFVEIDNDNLPRASQLTYRVNQFNTSALQRSESELRTLLDEQSFNGLLVSVRDRFGDYGLAGLMLFSQATSALQIDSFLLSCRALGRGVEHLMLNRLAEVAITMGLSDIEVQMKPSGRNQPAFEFFATQFSDCLDPATGRYRVPVARGLAVRHELKIIEISPDNHEHITAEPRVGVSSDVVQEVALAGNRAAQLAEIATRMVNAESIQSEVNSWRRRQRPETAGCYSEPQTDLEQQIAVIWSDVLGLDTVGRRDNFFELGGDSLAMVRIIVQLYDAIQIELPIEVFFDSPTIEMHAIKLASEIADQ